MEAPLPLREEIEALLSRLFCEMNNVHWSRRDLSSRVVDIQFDIVRGHSVRRRKEQAMGSDDLEACEQLAMCCVSPGGDRNGSRALFPAQVRERRGRFRRCKAYQGPLEAGCEMYWERRCIAFMSSDRHSNRYKADAVQTWAVVASTAYF